MLLATVLAAVGATRAQVVRQITDNKAGYFSDLATLDEAGPFIHAVSTTNQFGGNPDMVPQLFRWDPATGDGEMITDFPPGLVGLVSVSDDGGRFRVHRVVRPGRQSQSQRRAVHRAGRRK